MLCLRICSLKPNESRGIKILSSSRTKLGLQSKSFNRRPNSELGGSRSSTKMHEATIHDSHQQIRAKTPQNRRNESHTKNRQKLLEQDTKIPMSYKPGIDTTTKASIHSEVRFFTNGGKSNPREQGNEKQSKWMVCLETLELIYMSPLRARQKTTLPLALKL
jgi:hypothetical protein